MLVYCCDCRLLKLPRFYSRRIERRLPAIERGEARNDTPGCVCFGHFFASFAVNYRNGIEMQDTYH